MHVKHSLVVVCSVQVEHSLDVVCVAVQVGHSVVVVVVGLVVQVGHSVVVVGLVVQVGHSVGGGWIFAAVHVWHSFAYGIWSQ